MTDHVKEDTAESAAVSRHVIDLPGGELSYRAEAGNLLVRRDDASPLARVFYLAYRGEQAAAAWPAGPSQAQAPRPVTFAFNGGPGSASLWLNIGGFGPRRAPTSAPRPTPPAPYAYGDNPHTLLGASDLVFIDAPGTGFSRLADGVNPQEAWGVDQDVDIFARAITRYLTLTGSWAAPRYLFGESYGTARAAALVHKLQNQGLDFNGVILLSAILNWATTQPGLDQGYINLLPSYAAAAHYHGKASAGGPALGQFLAEARTFARTTYAQALQSGDELDASQEEEVAKALSGFIGLDPVLLRRKRLRVEMEDFRRELLAEQSRVIGRFDARFTAEHHYALGAGSADPATDDAATAGVNSAHLSAFHRHLADDLGYRSDLHYRHLYNMAIEGAWDWRHKAPGIDEPLTVPNVSLDLSAAMRRNPALRVLIMGGYYDLATPFAGAEFDVSHLHLGPALRPNVTFRWYESGHMTFVDDTAIAQMSADLAGFYGLPLERC